MMDPGNDVASAEGDHSDNQSWEDDFDFGQSPFGDDEILSRPIVVGYSFGPKKMSTMGVVMAEASQTKLMRSRNVRHTVEEVEEPLDDRDGTPLAVEAYDLSVDRNSNSPIQNTPTEDRPRSILAKQSKPKSQHPTTVIFSVDGYGDSASVGPAVGLRNIVRTLTSPASVGDDSSAHSTGTRTASTATTLASLRTGSFPSSVTHDTPLRAPSTIRGTPIRVSFVPLDPEIPLEEQHGGIDIILHKLTEDILLLSQLSMQHEELKSVLQVEDAERVLCSLPLSTKDLSAIRRVHRLCQFQKQHGCYLVDDPVSVQTLMSRADIAKVLNECLSTVATTKGVPVRTPKHAVVGDSFGDEQSTAEAIARAVREAQLQFPIIVKPLTAAGTKASHAMAVVTDSAGLEQITDRVPCLLQEYTNHDSVLYKVYVLGDFVSVHKRRSLPNLPAPPATSTMPVVEFDSQRPYPRLRDFGYSDNAHHRTVEALHSHEKQQGTLTSVDSNRALMTEPSATASSSPPAATLKTHIVTAEEVMPISDALKAAFGLEIFGFDTLISSKSEEQRMLVVDVNYFPSYKEVPDFPSLLAKYLTSKAIARRLERSNADEDINPFQKKE
mmetsp:Transcript_26742/g.73740  ORF Transcript_26742/g.73740 Transcript_26742/m.73740 type:complete len:610 (-) Transcript_26742:46-1875(-)